jgi:dihydroneopterin aldolase
VRADPADAIEIRGLRLLCHVGVTAGERATAQPLEVDVDLAVDLAAAAASDSVGDTVDYGVVSVAIAAAVQEGQHDLLERVAALAADAALGVDDRASSVTLTVRKLRPPVPLDVASTGVRLHRSRR